MHIIKVGLIYGMIDVVVEVLLPPAALMFSPPILLLQPSGLVSAYCTPL